MTHILSLMLTYDLRQQSHACLTIDARLKKNVQRNQSQSQEQMFKQTAGSNI